MQVIDTYLIRIVRTSPTREAIEHINANDGIVLNKRTACIDQVEHTSRTFKLGFKRVAVSAADFQTKAICNIGKLEEALRLDVLVFFGCKTCV